MVLGGAKRYLQGDDLDRFNSFPAKAIEGLICFFELLWIETHFVEGYEEKISAWLPLSMRILVTSHVSMQTMMSMASVWGNESSFISWEEKVIGMWDHLLSVMGPSTMM
jgi:hypothetical protein